MTTNELKNQIDGMMYRYGDMCVGNNFMTYYKKYKSCDVVGANDSIYVVPTINDNALLLVKSCTASPTKLYITNETDGVVSVVKEVVSTEDLEQAHRFLSSYGK